MAAIMQTFGEPISMAGYGELVFCHLCPQGQKIGDKTSATVCVLGPRFDPRYQFPYPHAEGRCEGHKSEAEFPVSI